MSLLDANMVGFGFFFLLYGFKANGESPGRISNIKLYADHHGTSHLSWQHMVSSSKPVG